MNHASTSAEKDHAQLSADILSSYESYILSYHQSCLKNWSTPHHRTLAFCHEQLKNALTDITALKDMADLQPVWARWQVYFRNMRTHLQTLSYISDADISGMLGNWEPAFGEWIAGFPAQVALPILPEHLQPVEGEAAGIRLWKFSRRTRNVFKKSIAHRQVPLHAFGHYYLDLPGTRFLLDEWEHFLRFAAQQLASAHRIMNETCRRFLFLDNAETRWQGDPAMFMGETLQSVQIYADSLQALIDDLESFIRHRRPVVEKYLADIRAILPDKLAYAGSYVLPDFKFGPQRHAKRQRSLEIHFLAHKKAWEKHFEAEKEDWIGDTSLKLVQLDVSRSYLMTVASLHHKVQEQVMPPLLKAEKIFDDTLARFGNPADLDKAQLRKLMNTEHYALLRALRKTVLPETTDAFVKAQFNLVINRFLHESQQTTLDLPDEQSIFTRRDTSNIPPRSEVDEIPLRELFAHSLSADLQTRCAKTDKHIQQRFTKIINGISELDQVVEFNLKAALDSLKDQDDPATAIKHFNDGLNRARERLQDFHEESQMLETQTGKELFDITLAFMHRVQELLEDEKLLELKLQLMQAKAKEKFRESRRKAWEFIKFALPRAWQWIKKFSTGIYGQYLRLGKITGLVTTSTTTQEQLFRFLTDTRQRINALPFIYQRLFESKPLTDERFFATGREAEMEQLKADLLEWENERFMSTVIVGEKGGGRTTLLNFAEKEIYHKHPKQKLILTETVHDEAELLPLLQQLIPDATGDTMDDFEASLMKLEKRQICIVENIQNLFLKTINGFQLMKRFLRLVAHTQERIFWVLSCTLYCWEYLDKVINISQQFQRVLYLGGLSRQQMETIILKRHRITGYELEFDVPESIKNSRQFRKLENEDARQNFLKDRFFEQLQDISQGNVSVAMLYWLRAIKKVEENSLILSASVDFDYSFIYQLSPMELFTLGALFQHETLNNEEHAQIFHHSPEKSDMIFNTLRRKGIIIPAHEGYYQLHPFLYRPAVRALKSNNILH